MKTIKEQEQILEGNKLIALFMGMEIIDEYTFRVGKFPNDHIDRGRLVYHSSWDALMPVCKKIANIDAIYSAGMIQTISKHDYEIMPVWEAVVQHLKLVKKQNDTK